MIRIIYFAINIFQMKSNSNKVMDDQKQVYLLSFESCIQHYFMYKRFMRDSMYKWVVMYQLSKPKPQSHNCPFLSTTPHRTHLLETTELYHVFVPRELFPHLVTVLVKHPCPLVLSVILIALIKYASLYAINQKHFSLQIFLS